MSTGSDLTIDYVRSQVSYDPVTGEFTWIVNRKHMKAGMRAGCKRVVNGGKLYRTIGVGGRKYMEHRLAFFIMTGEWPSFEVDHIDGDGCNNQWTNLRDVDGTTNRRNQRRMSKNKSGYTGVCWHAHNQKREVKIGVNGDSINLGYFESLEDAIAARKNANQKYGFHANHGSDRPL